MLKKATLLVFTLLYTGVIFSQSTFKAIIKDSSNAEAVIGATATLKGTGNGEVSDEKGLLELNDIPDGMQTIVLSLIGYETKEYQLSFPLASNVPVTLFMHSAAEELDEIIIEGTRSNRSIANTPTRVEVLTEEIDEASTMDPSKVAHLLTHSTGIQVQQTSATSNTANVRIQGLDGRYTQILKDGFPLYGGFSGSLSIMQIPPLDLRQVEYVKGSASTLYGGGAIAGLINLISKEPGANETLVHLNASHIGAMDVNAFMSRRIDKMGITLLAQRNTHKPFDADNDGYTDMPELTKYNFNPKLFYYFSDRTKISLGGTVTNEIREGGDTKLLNNEYPGPVHFYKETNDISRVTTQLKFDHSFSNYTFTARNSFNIFNRSLIITSSPSLTQYRFAGKQLSSFSEAAITHRKKQNVFIAGLNYYSDDFKEQPLQTPLLRNEGYNTIGGFANYTFDIGKMLAIESGLRADYVFNEKVFVLPRVSALFKWTSKMTTRIGGGMGYRNPTIFNQEAELLGYQNVLPVNKTLVKAEQSYGGNADIGYKTPLGDKFFLSINQMFFYTYLDRPLVLVNIPAGNTFQNAAGYTQSYGAETFFKFGFYNFVLFAGYTYTNATNHFGGALKEVTLTPGHSLKGDLLYSLPGKWRIAVDYEFKSSQTLSTGAKTPAYWTFGGVLEYTWKNFTVYGNVENFTDVRQTNYGTIRSMPYDTPQFTEVWAPLDGIVFNYGIKVRL
jgi:outer membrane receptor for ferrienterochelin and colicins